MVIKQQEHTQVRDKHDLKFLILSYPYFMENQIAD